MTFTTEHLTAFIAGGLSLIAILRVVAPLTKTPKDDEALAALDRGRVWISTKAPILWASVEVAAKIGSLPASVSKAVYFLELLKKSWSDAHQSEIPKDLEMIAQRIAAEISRGAK
jgi:hypothetical protein